jgi:hypothetical protein
MVVRTTDVLNRSVVIEDIINEGASTCTFSLIDRSSEGIPNTDDEVIIEDHEGNKIFGGLVVSVEQKKSSGIVESKIECVDYTRILDRYLVHKSYEDMTDRQIIADIVATYCVGLGITTNNVGEGITIKQISFNYMQISQALRRICELSGRNWYIDYDKDIHYFPLDATNAPFDIDSDNARYSNLRVYKDSSQLKNRVYVRGGTKLSDFTTYSVKGDGQMRTFVLPDKPHEISATVNDVTKSVGIKHIDTSGFDWYVNYQEKYLEQDGGASVLTSSDVLKVTYKYQIPILVAIEDTDSIEENGVHEFAIFDKNIRTTGSARERAKAELIDYANDLVEMSFNTTTTGFFSGQYMHIELNDYDLDDDYIIQSVVARSMGGGDFIYTVKLASAKTVGIIRFLISLLEADKNVVELDDDEVVDELNMLQDGLISDSLLDDLTIDSAGPNFTWCVDDETSPTTRMRWGLFQWG